MTKVTFLAAAGLALSLAAFAPQPVFAFGSTSDSSSQSDSNYTDAEKMVKAKDYKGAIPLLEKVLEKSPSNADALNYLGFSYRKLGEMDEAMEYYNKALAINPDHKGANEYMGELYLEMNNLDKAQERLSRLQQICGGTCEEYADLKEQIDAYKAKHTS
jgi:tetratricopeptide (TPR) repeat protein